MEIAGEITRARHEWTSCVTTLAQRGMKDIVTLNGLVTHAGCLNTHATRWSVSRHVTSRSRGCRWQQTHSRHQSSGKGRGMGKGMGMGKVDKGKKDGEEDDVARNKLRGKGECVQAQTG